MKALLISVTAGDGHNVTASAIARSLELRGCETKIADAYRISGPFFYHLVSKGYHLASTGLKYGYGAVYRILEHRPTNSYHLSPARLSGRSLAKKFKRLIDEYDPDVIVVTHPFAARILDITKERHGFRAASVAIVTDFTMHPYWEEALRLDRIVLPSALLLPLALKKGIQREKLLPLGIPIAAKFDVKTAKEEARRALGLSPDAPTLLLMKGTLGTGKLHRILHHLDRCSLPWQVIVVCGKSKKAYKKLSSHTYQKQVRILSYTEDIPRLMDAADLLITKPGGLTVSEALTRALPMIIVNPIPGQEDRNTEFLVAEGVAVKATRKLPVSLAASRIWEENRLCAMRACAEKLAKPNASDSLCELLFSLGGDDAK